MEQIVYKGNGERIDAYLAKNFNYSRSFFHHIFEREGIFVNQKHVKKSYTLKKNDIVEIDDLERYLDGVILEESPKLDLDVKIEKEDYLVIYKPKGVLSHPNSVWDVKSPSVVGFLYHNYKNLPSIGNFIRAGIIHRLDKETDGFMIIVKTEKGLKYFKDLFNRKSEAVSIEEKEKVKLKKYYRAIVNLDSDSEFFLKTMKLPYTIIQPVVPKVPFYGDPKIGITKILGIEFIGTDKARLDIEILTGRTHQIRYHLSKNGMPIVGDYLYGNDEDGEEMQLTAYKLEFEDVEGEYITMN